jgi:hypothetical protein
LVQRLSLPLLAAFLIAVTCANAFGQTGGDGQEDAKALAYDVRIFTRPARLGPGQSGELSVVLTFRDDTVVLPGTRIELRLDRDEGPVAFGSFTVDPARPASAETVYGGQDLYEENMAYRVPISIAADAVHGDYKLQGEVMVEGRIGKTGESLGLLSRLIEGRIVVGPPLPVNEARPDPTSPTSPPVPTQSGSVWPYFAAPGILGALCLLGMRRRRLRRGAIRA